VEKPIATNERSDAMRHDATVQYVWFACASFSFFPMDVRAWQNRLNYSERVEKKSVSMDQRSGR
jgi:hypothetical protein